ncbi:MAG TPA: hypothetical protein VFY82_14575 [Acidimicrobiales bacterium]|nr:hypothetical protein [Acidimicrobiales bacterium]
MHFRYLYRCLVSGVLVVGAACSDASGSASPEAEPPEPTFVRVEADDLAETSTSSSLADLVPPAQAGAPWTIVGSLLDPDLGEFTAAVWTSADAATWQRVDVPPADPEVSEAFAALAVHGAGRMAAGGIGAGADADAGFWREVDGGWQRLDVPGTDGDGRQAATRLVTDGTRALALGFENVDGEGRPLLWFTPDGEEWQSVDGGPGGVFDATGDESVLDIGLGPAGLVAVGNRSSDAGSEGLAWSSTDGVEWAPVDLPAADGAAQWSLQSVAVADGYTIGGSATISHQGTVPLVWRSADGRSWSNPTPLPLHDNGRFSTNGVAVDRLAATPDGWVASGGDWMPHVWQSTDGSAWTLAPDLTDTYFPDGVDLGDVDAAGGLVVALGSPPAVLRLSDGAWEVSEGAEMPNGGAAPQAGAVSVAGDSVVVGGRRTGASTSERFASSTGAVWTRAADGTWRRRTIGLDAGPVHDLVATATGVVAVGMEQRLGAMRRGGANFGPDGVVWTRDEDEHWTRIGTEALPPFGSTPDGPYDGAEPPSTAPVGGPGNSWLDAVVPVGQGWIAVGGTFVEDGSGGFQGDGLVVASSDGLSWGGEDAAAGGVGDQSFDGACVAPDGSVVAVGSSSDRSGGSAVVRHRDPQGVWVAGAPEGGGAFAEESHSVWDCAASEDGYVVVGEVDAGRNDDAAVWTSSDGITWARLDDDLFGGAGDQSAAAVVALPSGGWLVGGADDSSGDEDAALWRIDADGEVTRRDAGEAALGGRGDQRVYDLAVVDDGLVVVGADHLRVGLWESPVVDR